MTARSQVSMQAIVDQLEESAQEKIHRMQETDFVNYFLPMFACDPELDTRERQKRLAFYINGAGGIHRRVHVVDTAGNILFTIPPVGNHRIIEPTSGAANNRHGLFDVIYKFQQLSGNLPGPARNFLVDALEHHSQVLLKNGTTVPENERVWMEIFKRYNIKTSAESQVQAPKNPTNVFAEEDESF